MATHKPAVIIAGTAQALPSGDGLQDIASIESGLVLNESGAAVDFRVEGDSADQLFLVEGGFDRILIGTTVAGAIAAFHPDRIVFNESGDDRDFRVESHFSPYAFILDAGTGSVQIGSQSAGDIAFFGDPITGATIFNNSNMSLDFVVKSVNDGFSIWLDSSEDSVRLGSVSEFKFETHVKLYAPTVAINSFGNDYDFQVGGSTLSHMIFTDGSSSSENLALVSGTAPDWQSMNRGIFIGDVATAPTGNPTDGVFMWSESGELKARDGAGNVTTLTSPSGGAVKYDVKVFTSTGTWTKPSGAINIHVSCIGGGGGGGSGRRGATSTFRGGGGGGGGGGYSFDTFAASSLASTVSVTVGSGGAGAAAAGPNDTNGTAGTGGGNTSFGTHLTANGGSGGGAGTNSVNGSGGSGGAGAGSVSETGGAGGTAGNGSSATNKLAGAGGGAGAGLSASNAYSANGTGGTSGGVGGDLGGTVFNAVSGSMAAFWGNPGAGGATLIAVTQLQLAGGGGGGGGNTSQTTTSGAVFSGWGGTGGNFGGGGGGAGSSTNNIAATSRGGANGGDGICVVVTELPA